MEEKTGGGEGSAGKGIAGMDLMREGDTLFGGVENEGVFADDFAGADRVDVGVRDVFYKMEGGSAGSVFFLGVVGFNEVDVGREVVGCEVGEFV